MFNEVGVKTVKFLPQWAITQDSANNAAVTLTKAAEPGKTHHVTAIDVSISGATAVNDITIVLKDGNTAVWKTVIGSGAPRGDKSGIVLVYPIGMTVGAAAKLEVSAGGAGVVTSANMAGHTV